MRGNSPMFRRELPLSVLLRLPGEEACYCCLYVASDDDPVGVRPCRSWTEAGEGDEVVVDGTAYVIERVVPLERPGRCDPKLAESIRRQAHERLLALAGAAR